MQSAETVTPLSISQVLAQDFWLLSFAMGDAELSVEKPKTGTAERVVCIEMRTDECKKFAEDYITARIQSGEPLTKESLVAFVNKKLKPHDWYGMLVLLSCSGRRHDMCNSDRLANDLVQAVRIIEEQKQTAKVKPRRNKARA